jgi:hypothetical protein
MSINLYFDVQHYNAPKGLWMILHGSLQVLCNISLSNFLFNPALRIQIHWVLVHRVLSHRALHLVKDALKLRRVLQRLRKHWILSVNLLSEHWIAEYLLSDQLCLWLLWLLIPHQNNIITLYSIILECSIH